MLLTPGQSLGTFEIVSLLGKGGMGEVYQAKDTRLDRLVAIKVLRPELADDAERRQRFEREARTASALNHPHICTLYDIGVDSGIHFMVMEYLKGSTLAERLGRGPLPRDQALQVASQIADALDRAHRHGIVHRDLKPGNIMLTSLGAKLLDFGLAKEQRSVGTGAGDSNAATQERGLTKEGSLVGTLRYMAPEQLEGKSADSRTDIFAFGALLHEMLTGKPAFDGDSQASLIGAILHETPASVSELSPLMPHLLDRIVAQCLAKDPEGRWQSAGDLIRALEWLDEDVPARSEPSSRRFGAVTLAVCAIVASIATWLSIRAPTPTPPPVSRLSLLLPGLEAVSSGRFRSLSVSRDGRRIAYVSRTDEPERSSRLYARALDEPESRPLPGTENAHTPFFSPNGEWVGFFADQELKKVAFAGGAPVKLGDAPFLDLSPYVGAGADWISDGTIVFTVNGALQRVSENGGAVEAITELDRERDEVGHGWPFALPDGSGVVFTVWTHDGGSRIASVSLGDGDVHDIGGLDGAHQARYVPSGHLVYAQGGTLWAAAFDSERRIVRTPRPALEGVLTRGLPFFSPETQRRGSFRNAHFDLSESGTLLYVPGSAPGGLGEIVWVDRSGREEQITREPRVFQYPRLSPDDRSIAVTVGTGRRGIWIFDSERGNGFQLSLDSDSVFPVWTPDGARIAFSSDRLGAYDLFWKSADGTDEAELLFRSEISKWPQAWTPNQRRLIFYEARPSTSRDIFVLPIEPGADPSPLVATPANERGARLSPDGNWFAYVSNESGRDEVYVQPFPAAGGKWVVSSGGGSEPIWSPVGSELFYRRGDAVMSVSIRTEPTFSPSEPAQLFQGPYRIDPAGRSNYDVSADGERFLMIRPPTDSSSDSVLNVVLNWHEELQRLVPTNDN